jgi:hypothetical protein
MSVESLLLIAFLIVLPLLERLARVLRARASQRPDEPAVGPPHQPPASIPSPVLTPPELPPRHPAVERLSAGERVLLGRMSQPATPAVLVRAGNLPSRVRHVFSLSQSADLRRAMMLVVILGPCKALEDGASSVPGRERRD